MLNQDRLQRIQEERARRVGGEPAGYSGQDFNVNIERIRQERMDRITAVQDYEQAKSQPEKEPMKPSEDPKNNSWWEKTINFVKKYPSPLDFVKEKVAERGGVGSMAKEFYSSGPIGQSIEQKSIQPLIESASGKGFKFGLTGEEAKTQGQELFNAPMAGLANPSDLFSKGKLALNARVALIEKSKQLQNALKTASIEARPAIENALGGLDDAVKKIDIGKITTLELHQIAQDFKAEGLDITRSVEGKKPILTDMYNNKPEPTLTEVPKPKVPLTENEKKNILESVKKKEISGTIDPIEQQNKRLQIMDQIKKEKPEVDIPSRVKEIPPERIAKIEKVYPNADDAFKVKSNTAINVVNETPKIKDDVRSWLKNTYIGKAKAQEKSLKFREEGKAFNIDDPANIYKHQSGESYAGREITEREFKALREKAIANDIPVEERKNYLPGVYKESPEEIQQAVVKAMQEKGMPEEIIKEYLGGKELPAEMAKSLKMNPFFSMEKVFSSYAEAEQFGLHPKYTKISQLIGHYEEKLNETISNNKFLEDMVAHGNAFTTGGGGRMAVNLPGKEGLYFAEPKVAGYLNDYFRNEEGINPVQKFLKYSGKVMGGVQNVVLTGGPPKTNFNFLTAGYIDKYLKSAVGSALSGDVRSAVTHLKSLPALIRTNSTFFTRRWFEKEIGEGMVLKAAKGGVDVTDFMGNYKETSRGFIKFWKNNNFKQMLGEGYDKVFGEKTFKGFIPMQKLTLFKDTYKTAIRKGLSEDEAIKLGGDTVRNLEGIFERVRGKTTEDAFKTFAFAPQFREGLIHTYWNTLKSLSPTTWTNPAFKQNRKLLIGSAAVLFGGYELLNRKLNGHSMLDNPEGKKTELMIPGKNGKVYFVPFAPSQLAFYRNAVEAGVAVAEGDEKTAVQKVSSNLSMGLKLAGDIIANRDYFGNEIYDNQAPRSEKYADIAKYLGMNANHPYFKGVWQQVINQNAEKQPIYPTYEKISKLTDEGKREEAQKIIDLLSREDKLSYEEIKKQKVKPIGQVMSEMMEVPLRFSSAGKIKSQEYYKKIDEITRDIKSVPEIDRTEKIQEYMNNAPETDRRGLLWALGKANIDTEGVSISEDIIKMKPTFNKIKELLSAGNIAEAKNVLKGMSKDDIESFKKVKASEQAKKTKRSKLEMQPVFDEVKSLVQQGKTAEAKRILSTMNEEELRIFKLLKESS
jgi:hypothetical protein